MGESHWKLKDTYDFGRKRSGVDAPRPHYGLKAQHERRHGGKNRARVEKDPGHWRGRRGHWVPKNLDRHDTTLAGPRKSRETVNVFEPEKSTIRAEL